MTRIGIGAPAHRGMTKNRPEATGRVRLRPPEAPVRTVLLAAIAAVLAIVWLARSFEIETGELTGFFLMSLAVVAGIAFMAALTVSIAKMIRPRRRQDRSMKNRSIRGA